MPLHPAAEMILPMCKEAGLDLTSETRRRRTRAKMAAAATAAVVPTAPVHRVEDRVATGPTSMCRCASTGRTADDGLADPRVVPRRRLGDRQHRHARQPLPAAVRRGRARSSCPSTTASRPRRSSRARPTTASRRGSGSRTNASRAAAATRRGSRSVATARAATSRRCVPRRARRRGCRCRRFQLLVYPVTDHEFDSAVDGRQRSGLLPGGRPHALVLRSLHADCRTTSPTGGCRRCARRSRRPPAPRSSSPPSTTRCATRARRTPTSSTRRGRRAHAVLRGDGIFHGFFGMHALHRAGAGTVGHGRRVAAARPSPTRAEIDDHAARPASPDVLSIAINALGAVAVRRRAACNRRATGSRLLHTLGRW